MSLETMTKLASTTVGVTAQSSISFTNIPQGYTDLVIKVSGRTAAAQGVAELSFNLVTTNLNSRILYAIGSGTPGSASYASTIRAGYIVGTDYTASTFSNNEIYIPSYSGNNYKSISIDSVTETNAAEAYSSLNAGLWSNSSPITSLTFTVLSNNTGTPSTFTQHSTFTLYGVKNAAQTAGNSIKATGGNIVFDGTYVSHIFNSSGTFTPTQPLLVDYLVVAGGASGAGGLGGVGSGGGGAGGFRTSIGSSPLSLNVQSYPVIVGAGGASVTVVSTQGNNGSNSEFTNITSTGGGGGGTYGNPDGTVGSNGGSGGGGGVSNGGGSPAGGAASPSGQGNAGGAGGTAAAAPYRGGGGGGAGAVGLAASVSGNGGAGLASSITGPSITYAGGGGAGGNPTPGTGGTGGGGAGANTAAQNASNATQGTGGGGGGSCGGDPAGRSGAGGSGVVIIRYKG